MSSIGTGYDQSVTTFSPDGRVFQVEYATKAVDNSSTAVGIRCKDGVVMAVEKPKLSKMIVEGSNRRILTVDKHSGICVSGMIADARQIVNHGRGEAQRYLDFYGSPIPGTVLSDRISGMMHMYTLYWTVRPFGCTVLIGSYSEDGPRLHAVSAPSPPPTPVLLGPVCLPVHPLSVFSPSAHARAMEIRSLSMLAEMQRWTVARRARHPCLVQSPRLAFSLHLCPAPNGGPLPPRRRRTPHPRHPPPFSPLLRAWEFGGVP